MKHATTKARRPRTTPRVVFVPAQTAMAFTADRGWHLVQSPPDWWLEQQLGLVDQEVSRG